uniref:Uncharacterized protein n=1 Tax=Kalanchoe fedtschenkoi TaxID=63787 RepID=A0A7N0V9A5_KALFE
MKVVERHSVAPPPGSVPSTTLPLSFLDILWLVVKPVQRTFLYRLPSLSTPHFLQNILPNLKHSLSLALLHFFPVAVSIVFHWDQPGSRPYIHYEEGYSVALTVGESDKDFDLLVNRDGEMIDDAILRELVPCLSAADQVPLFAVQMTVFPSRGICVGIAYKHALGDGRSVMNFMNTWSSICRSSGALPPLPVLDRSLVTDPSGVLQDILLQQLKSLPQPSFFDKVDRPVLAK